MTKPFRLAAQPRLLDQITVDHGPRADLAAFFLAADRAARDRGVTLSLSTDFELLREVNAMNLKHWHPLAPNFDSSFGGISSENGFWLIGRNADDEIVTTQVARFYDLGETNLGDHIRSLRLFYPDPDSQKRPEESCSAPSVATIIHGNVVFSGGGWVRPDYRRQHMMLILPRISRALALTRWDTEYTFSLVSHDLVNKGVAKAYGYRRIEPGIRWMNSQTELRLDGTLVWMPRAELLADMEDFPRLLEAAENRRDEAGATNPNGLRAA